MDRALIALCGLLINAVVAGPGRWYRVMGIGKLARVPDKLLRELESRLSREHENAEQREMRGQMVTAGVIIFALIAGFICGALFKGLDAIQMIILMFALPVRPIYDRAAIVRKQLQIHNIAAARQALDQNLWRHLALLDEHGLSRAAIETLAIGFSEKILSPIFWYICAGMPGLFITLCINLMQEVMRHPNEPNYGKASAWAYDIWHYPPSRIAAIFWLIACLFLPDRDVMMALKGIGRRLITASPQTLALASSSFVLKLSLGGPTSAYGNHRWLDAGTVKAVPAHIARALYLFALLNLLIFITLGFFL